MTNQALRDKLFHALRGDLWPGNPELDQMALADVDAIMPIVDEYINQECSAFGFRLYQHLMERSTKPLINPD